MTFPTEWPFARPVLQIGQWRVDSHFLRVFRSTESSLAVEDTWSAIGLCEGPVGSFGILWMSSMERKHVNRLKSQALRS